MENLEVIAGLTEAVSNTTSYNAEETSNWFKRFCSKSDYKETVVGGKLDDMITEAEYKCEGDR